MKKVIIIGGGIAGLTAGIYAAQCGFDAQIYEMHSIAGGNCTSWRRKGYLFEGGMHWLTGSSDKTPLNKIWRNIGAIDSNTRFSNPETQLVYNYEGTNIYLYRDARKLREHFNSISPEDSKATERMYKDIIALSKLSMPLIDLKGLKVTKKSAPPISMLPALLTAMPRMNALNKMSCRDYAEQFKHEGIRHLLINALNEDYYASALIFTLAAMTAGDGGFPAGGSLPFVERIEKRFNALGGKLHLKSQVERVVVENGRASGVIVNGERINADAIIVTLDTMAVEKLFDTPLKSEWLDEMRKTALPTNCSFISIGVNADLSKLPHSYSFKLKPSIEAGGVRLDYIVVNNYAKVPGYSPKGKSSLTVSILKDTYDFWKAAKANGTYAEKKHELGEAIASAIAEEIPQVKGNIEVIDVATPVTYERYCSTWRGSWMTHMPKGAKNSTHPCIVDNLAGCYFAGQRMTPPGGLPVAGMSGRTAVQQLCKDNNVLFKSEE